MDLDNVHTGSETMRQLKGFDKNGDNKISADEIIDMADEIGKQEREKRAQDRIESELPSASATMPRRSGMRPRPRSRPSSPPNAASRQDSRRARMRRRR